MINLPYLGGHIGVRHQQRVQRLRFSGPGEDGGRKVCLLRRQLSALVNGHITVLNDQVFAVSELGEEEENRGKDCKEQQHFTT